jgi:RNA 3'-terminal phosphate cyclase (ATP)
VPVHLPQGHSQLLTGAPTLHTRTACLVAEALTGARFSIAAQNGSTGLWVLACDGAGVAAPEIAQAGASTL